MTSKNVWKSKEMIIATFLALGLLGATAAMVVGSEGQARKKLQERTHDRTEAGATFVGVYMREMLAREARLAELYFADEVTPQRMELLTRALDSSAAVVLDSDGDLLGGFPHNPSMIGTRLSSKYAHLAAAVEGTPTISPVVLSAVEGIPVVAAATPFDTANGRRVFSAALSITGTPLAQYLETMIPMNGASAHLFDITGTEVINNPGAKSISATVAEVEHGSGVRTIDGMEYFYVAEQIEGAPWKIVTVAPTASLYAPFQASRWGAWIAVGALAAFALALLYVFSRFLIGRQKFRHRALHCPLTGLANRHLLAEHASRELAKLARMDGSVALLYFDLDDFKSVNDTYGHDGGDQLLVQVADRLHDSLRPYDVAARIGGDEFAVLLPNVVREDAEELAARILFSLQQPYILGGTPVRVCSSIGIALSRSVVTLDDFLAKADAAMYEAKKGGKSSFRVAAEDNREISVAV